MRTTPTILLLLLLTTPLCAQKMGGENAYAAKVSNTVQMDLVTGDKANLTLWYFSITWARGWWADALGDERRRDGMREQINTSAQRDPLGGFTSNQDLKIGGQAVAAGEYHLGFMLDEEFEWQLVLMQEDRRIPIPLPLVSAGMEQRRLRVHLDAGEEDFTARIRVAFGAQQGEVPIVLDEAPRPTEAIR